MIVKSCDIIYATKPNLSLVAISTAPDRIQAATVLETDKDALSLTMPGTFFAENLGRITIVGALPAAQIAKLLAEVFFKDYPNLLEEHTLMWSDSLERSTRDSPFEIADL